MAYSPNGTNLIFSTFFGSHGTDDGNGIALDSNDNIYIAGDTDSDQFPVTAGAIQPTRKGNVDGVFAMFTPTGQQLTYSTFFGGSGNDTTSAVAVDQYGNAYLTGFTQSFDFPLTSGSAQTTPGGGMQDAFFAKIGFSNPNNISPTSTGLSPAVQGNPVSQFQRAPGNFTRADAEYRRKTLKTSPYEYLFRRHHGFDSAAGSHPAGQSQ
jgi:hypothetical protein